MIKLSELPSVMFKRLFYSEHFKVFKNLKKHQNFNSEQKLNYQIAKLKDLLKHANKIPFYQEHLANIDIDHITYEDFLTIPFLTKDLIRNNTDQLVNNEYAQKNDVFLNTSGGSTGVSVSFYQTKEQSSFGRGNYHYANYLNGVTPDDRMLVLWGAKRDMHKATQKTFFGSIKSYLSNSLFLNTFVLSDDIMHNYISKANFYKPKVIKAYVHSLYDISKLINREEIKVDFTPVIHTSTGPLYPEVRSEIKKAFNNCHVFSFYGSREVSAIATEVINETGMHVLYDNVLVEIVGDNGFPVKPGEEGEIVVTTLNNKYMPLIRYKIGDRGVNGNGTCDFGTLSLKTVLGRTLGVLQKKDGTKIDGQFFVTLFFNAKGIKQFQIIQKSIDLLVVKIVKDLSFDIVILNDVLSKISEELVEIDIQVNYTEEIELTKTGKIMYVFSEIAE